MSRVKINIHSRQGSLLLRDSLRRKIKAAVLKTLSLEGQAKKGQINICFVNDDEMQGLNCRYLGRNTPTDVLTFDLSEKSSGFILADIAISTTTASKNAQVFHTSPLQELYRYVVHGVLHLLSYDDKTAKQKRLMEGQTQRILKKLKII